MLKKITFSEKKVTFRAIRDDLRNEFGWVMNGSRRKFSSFLSRYPKGIFLLMIAIILGSIVLRFTLLRGPATRHDIPGPTLEEAFDTIRQQSRDPARAIRQLEELMRLRAAMERVLAKPSLSREDSIFIIQTGEQIKNLQHEIPTD
ncbi:hypothetical protein V9K67_23915 [Paraflavisolibacter sp. H34]|uniref:hypothetical protein n=1 Tax=Huijunlia imazamoxiresistens TaxID=3127457 RepID=UPI0030186DE7